MRTVYFHKFAMTLLLGAVFLLPFFSARNFSPSFDEHSHLPSGYSYLKTGEIRLNPQHPPLIKELAALPLLFLKPVMPELTADTNEWDFGLEFLFGGGNDADKLLFWGRLPIILISVLLGFFVYKWTSELAGLPARAGHGAGLAALFLYAFMPNILAHAQFVTTDLGVSAFSFITLYWLWKYFKTRGDSMGGLKHRPQETSPGRASKHLIFTGLFLGLALGSKFSAALILPVIAILILVYLRFGDNTKLPAKAVNFFKIIVPVSLLGFAVVYLLYFFPKDPLFYWKGLTSIYADKSPNAFFYLNGNFSQSGWWHYFIVTFLIKTPIPFLLLLAGVIFYFKKLRLSRLDSVFIAVPILVFFIVTSWKALDMGIRYLLPVYPFLIMPAGVLLAEFVTGKGGIKFFSRKFTIILAVVLVGWYAFSTLRVYPDFLAYFNEWAGGPDGGAKYLDGSNLDWGYDLKRLKEYQQKNPETKIVWNQAWSGFDYYGIKNNVFSSETWWAKPQGRYAVSANLVIRTKLRAITRGDSVDWLETFKPIDRIGQSFFIYQF